MHTAPRLNLLKVAGYRSLRDADLKLGDLTVLIGANGAGKSNVLDVLRCLNALRRGALRTFVGVAGGASTLLHRHRTRCSAIDLTLAYIVVEPPAGMYPVIEYSARLHPTRDDGLVFDSEAFIFEPVGLPEVLTMTGARGIRESRLLDETDPQPVRELWFPPFTLHHFHDTGPNAPLRTPARAGDHGALREDGGNLAACLLRLRNGANEAERIAWGAILSKVREVAPNIHRLLPTLDESTQAQVRLDWEDAYGNVFGCHQLSDGSLRAIALLTALNLPELPALLAFDEPELGLHPAALATVAAALRSTSSRTQVLVATQSPLLLDEVPPESVVVCESSEGATTLRHLDPVALEAWLREYSLSDLWHMNVLGGRP